MKWFLTLSDLSPSFKADVQLAKVAVYTAKQKTFLEPFCLYDGGENEFTLWLKHQGVKVIGWKTPHFASLKALGEKYLSIGTLNFLSVEIPKVMEKIGAKDERVLSTDIAVIFQRDVVEVLQRVELDYLAVAAGNFNTGVMLINPRKMLECYEDFNKYIAENLDKLVSKGYAQRAYGDFFAGKWQELPSSLNWRSYWEVNKEAQIVHFHGVRPNNIKGIIEQLQQGSLPDGLMDFLNYNYLQSGKLWQKKYLEIASGGEEVEQQLAFCKNLLRLGVIKVKDVARATYDINIIESSIDSPVKGANLLPGLVVIRGWVLGSSCRATTVELLMGDQLLGTTVVNKQRVDVAKAFPQVAWAESSGFCVVVALQGEGEIEVRAVLEDGIRVSLGRVVCEVVAGENWLKYATLAQEKAEAGEKEEAIALYELAISLDADEAWPYIKLAKLVEREKQWGLYEKAIFVEENNPWGYIGMVRLLKEDGKLKEALDKCVAGLRGEPGNKQLGLWEKEIRELLAEKPAWWQLAKLAEKKAAGEEARAIALYEKAIELGCNQEWVYIKLGGIYNNVGKHKLAYVRFARAIAINNQNVWGYIGAVNALKEEERFAEALEKCKAGLQFHPGNKDLEFLKGEIRKFFPEIRVVEEQGNLMEASSKKEQQQADLKVEGEWKIFTKKECLKELYSSKTKLLVAAIDLEIIQKLKLNEEILIYTYVTNNRGKGEIKVLGEKEVGKDLVELKIVPTFCLGFLTVSEQGEKEIEELVNWWKARCREDAIPPLLKLKEQAEQNTLQAEFWQLIARETSRETNKIAARLSKIQREYLDLRTHHENLQNAFAVVEEYISQAKLPPLQLAFENPPEKQAVKPKPGTQNKTIVKQLLPIPSRGLALIELYIEKSYQSATGELRVTVEGIDDRNTLGHWEVPYSNLRKGWLGLDLPNIDLGRKQEIQVTVEWLTRIGQEPWLGMGAVQYVPEFQIDLNGEKLNHSLAMRLWTGLPGTRKVVSPYLAKSTDTPELKFGYLQKGTISKVREITPNLSEEEMHYIRYLKAGEKILTHPRGEGLTIAMIPAAFRPGANQLTATVETQHIDAPAVEYALALITKNMNPEECFEQDNPELALAYSGWITVEPQTPTQIRLAVAPSTEEYYDIVMATRIPKGKKKDYAWATWLNFLVEKIEGGTND